MTDVRNSFEQGTLGAALAAAGSGGGTDVAWDNASNASSVLTYDNTHVYSGTKSMKITSIGSNTSYVETTTALGTTTEVWGRVWVYLTSNPASAWIFWSSLNGGTNTARIAITTGGKVRLDYGASNTVLYTSTAAVNTNGWTRIEWHIKYSTTVGQFDVRIFKNASSNTWDEASSNGSALNIATQATQRRWGALATATTAPGTFWMDVPEMSTAGWIGPLAIATPGTERSGVYTGSTYSAATDFGTWRNKSVDYVHEFQNRGANAGVTGSAVWTNYDGLSSAAAAASAGWVGSQWFISIAPWATTVTGTVGTTGQPGNWADAAAGNYDSHYDAVVAAIMAAGQGACAIRLFWEWNGNFSLWSTNAAASTVTTAVSGVNYSHNPTGVDQRDNFILVFKRFVTKLRAAGFTGPVFLSPAHGKQSSGLPNPDYVADGLIGYIDGILPDAYDRNQGTSTDTYPERWQDVTGHDYTTGAALSTSVSPFGFGMDFWRDYCASHLRSDSVTPLAFGFGEWGTWDTTDDPAYMDDMRDYIDDCLNALGLDVWQAYFNATAVDGDHYLGPNSTAFPAAAAEYKVKFGLPLDSAPSTGLTPRYFPVGGLWVRRGHPSISPPNNPTPPTGYDWTVNPYGSVYDARASAYRDAGGYTPDATTSGIPSGVTLLNTVNGTSSILTITSAATSKGTATISASTDTVTLNAHGMSNGQPIYFTSLTGGSGLFTGPVNWYVVANATTNTFTLRQADPNTGLFSDVNITTNYTAAAVTAGLWYDLTTFNCHITCNTTSVGLVLITRSLIQGPAVALGGYNGSFQAQVYNVSSSAAGMIFVTADCEFHPQAPVNKLNASHGPNVWNFRQHTINVVDNHNSTGNVHIFGGFQEKAAWFYPAPNQNNGSHCDALMQVSSGDVHVARGNYTKGFVDATVSATTDPTNFPIPANTNSCLIIGAGTPLPSNVDFQRNQLAGGTEAINIAAANFPNMGQVINNQIHLRDALRGTFTQGIVAPQTGSGFTLHADIPTSGSRANIDENGTAIPPFVATGSTVVWP